jgi:hypothetical protein
MQDTLYLDNYEKILQNGLLKVCSGENLLGGEMLDCPDADEKWDGYIKDYIADAVENINEYPEAAIAWAGFLGMAVAHNWDGYWTLHRHDAYKDYYGGRGWDDMDEHILHGVLGLDLDGPEAKKISNTLQNCALAALGLIRHEGIETQTELGFFVFARTYTVLFRIGVSMELFRLGYKKELVDNVIS